MNKMTIALMAISAIGGVFYGGSDSSDYEASEMKPATEKRIFRNENGRFTDVTNSEAKTESESKTVVSTNRTEQDIYAIESKADGIVNVPLKAMYMQDGDVEFFLLADGNGAFYISFDKLVDGNNYIGFVTYGDKLVSVIDGNFEFTYEEIFNDDEYADEYERIAKELVDQKVFKF